MNGELAPASVPFALPAVAPADLVTAFLAGRNPRTLDAYNRDLSDFARFLGQPDARAAVGILLASPPGQANAIALAYRTHLDARQLAAATIGRRLAALRSVVKLGRTLGLVTWALEIPSPRSQGYRDTAGPGLAGWRTLLSAVKAAAGTGTAKGARDLALLRLLHDLALRRGEVLALDLADVDFEGETVGVIGKGKTEAVRLTLPDPVRDALARWVVLRGESPGALFTRLDRARGRAAPALEGDGPDRLTGRALHKLIGALGRQAGLGRAVRPHGLRHQAITRALDLSGGNVREVRLFSRHVDMRTLVVYDDARRDAAGAIAKQVSED
jgi:integrase/recombinase XerC